MRRGDEVRRSDWRSSRAEGADWRRDDGPSRHVSPEVTLDALLPAPAPAKKKKKSKNKKAAGATQWCLFAASSFGALSRGSVPQLGLTASVPARIRCASTADAPNTTARSVRLHRGALRLFPILAYNCDFRGSESAWEVTETAPLVYSVPFPSAKLLWVCSHGPIRCPINQLLISVQAATSEPDPVPPLEKVWVLVYGLPRGGIAAPRVGKLTHILKAISEPVGKLITADLASFEDDGPACINILCPVPAEIDGLSLIFYFGSKGRRLTFELESPTPVVQLDPALAGTELGDGGLDEEGGSSEEGSSSEGGDDTGGAPPEPSDGRHSPGPSAAGQSRPVGGSLVGTLASVVAVGMEIPLPASPIPVVAAEEEVSVGLEVYPASSPCSPSVVCYSRSSGSPPSPTLGSTDPRPPAVVDPGWVSSRVLP
ncbi:hypothetical protein ZWY2020_054218 [Hordeum vulgare]|nr:hypothetical protein ZWY2020_054218 [Hordeum vulgare]